jgi:hypothetical protein
MAFRPEMTRLPDCHTVFSLQGGRVGKLAMDRYTLPECARGWSVAAPGTVRDDTLAMLPMAAELADRMVPWCKIHVVPCLLHEVRGDMGCEMETCTVDGRVYERVGGLAFAEACFCLLAASSPLKVLQAICHEAMHLCWPHLPADWRGILEAEAMDGIDWPGEYWPRVTERVARMYEAWCWAFLEGRPGIPVQSIDSVDSIFNVIWTGRAANAWIESGKVAVPFDVIHRRGLG